MIRGAALTGALLTTLATPAIWPLALAVFLLRGGLLLVVLPIVVLPSPVGLGNILAPTVMTVVFGSVPPELAVLVGLILLTLLAWAVVGGLAAASLEAEAARMVLGDEDPGDPPERVATRILTARSLVHLPTAVVAAWASVRLVSLTYRELTSPLDVTTPIVVRVLRGAPEVVVAIVLAWMAGEILGGLAARQITLGDLGVIRAVRQAIVTAARRPLGVLIGYWVPTIGLVVVLLPSTLATSLAWQLVRGAMRSHGDPFAATLAVVLFVTVWLVGLVLIAVTAAWRSAVWSIAYRDWRSARADRAGSEPG